MRNLQRVLVAIVAVLAIAMPASAQFRFGLRAGTNINSLDLKDLSSNFSAENRAGLSAGLTVHFTVPLIGLGGDLSAMYVHRVNEMSNDNLLGELKDIVTSDDFRKQDYLEIPLHLRYELTLPGVSMLAKPLVYTGPSIAFLCSKQAIVGAYQSRKFDASWDLGLGVQIINHIEISANYSWGLTDIMKYTGNLGTEPVNLGKRNSWTITAAYLF